MRNVGNAMIFGILGLLVEVLIIVLAVIGAKHLIQTRTSHGLEILGEVFKYLALFASVFVFTFGIAGLIGRLISRGTLLTSGNQDLAISIALTVIGAPLTYFLYRWIRSSFRKDPHEIESPIWRIYLLVATTTSLIILVVALRITLMYLVADGNYDSNAIARVLVATPVFVIHYRIQHQSIFELIHKLIGALFGLIYLIVGAVGTLSFFLIELFGISNDLLSPTKPLHSSLIDLAIGIPIWFFYWQSVHERFEEILVKGYLILIGVLGTVVMALIGLTFAANSLIIWLFGNVQHQTRGEYFADTPNQLAIFLVLTVAYYFHRNYVVRSGDEIQHIYDYLMLSIFLVLLSIGLVTTFVALFERLANQQYLSGASIENTPFTALVLDVVAIPFFTIFWRRTQFALSIEFEEEHNSPARRVFMYFALGVPSLIAIGAAIFTLYSFINTLLSHNGNLLWNIRIPASILLVTCAVSIFHLIEWQKENKISAMSEGLR